METGNWIEIDVEPGRLSAELIRILFESRNIPVYLAQEGAGAAYGLTVGPLGAVSVYVPESRLSDARDLLADYYAGKLDASIDNDEVAQIDESTEPEPHDELDDL